MDFDIQRIGSTCSFTWGGGYRCVTLWQMLENGDLPCKKSTCVFTATKRVGLESIPNYTLQSCAFARVGLCPCGLIIFGWYQNGRNHIVF